MKMNLPFGAIEVIASENALVRLDFLSGQVVETAPANALLRETQQQLFAYAQNAKFQFDLPLRLDGTVHQLKVWHAIADIPVGATRRYLDIAQQIQSSPRAVGGACGRNPLPIVIPCHRIVAAHGLGGFNANRNGVDWMPIKRWLLAHEGIISKSEL
ncbi:methylated-DNA--[protein]-cysteine S-methyltransferase [Chitinibacter bivalviorum]|uniref:Methylated-DNA--[protein]-cysteine S-methyltransferase n=2 Tax=Chitinibacter bivalviorum TaxID=2739434 RepID=A0A7H9BMB3_9NEIS|nr:methylated-DNA--[protein]-cysteine S-methyltransferase [Chitinibacter bivalviorum]